MSIPLLLVVFALLPSVQPELPTSSTSSAMASSMHEARRALVTLASFSLSLPMQMAAAVGLPTGETDWIWAWP